MTNSSGPKLFRSMSGKSFEATAPGPTMIEAAGALLLSGKIWKDAPVMASRWSLSSAAACFSESLALGCWIMTDLAWPWLARVAAWVVEKHSADNPIRNEGPLKKDLDGKANKRRRKGRKMYWQKHEDL